MPPRTTDEIRPWSVVTPPLAMSTAAPTPAGSTGSNLYGQDGPGLLYGDHCQEGIAGRCGSPGDDWILTGWAYVDEPTHASGEAGNDVLCVDTRDGPGSAIGGDGSDRVCVRDATEEFSAYCMDVWMYVRGTRPAMPLSVRIPLRWDVMSIGWR